MLHWLAHVLGQDNASGGFYLALSGWVGDLTIVGAVAVYYRRHQCHARWCPWWAKHPVNGTPFATCTRHHPHLPNQAPTAEHIAEAANGTDVIEGGR